MSSQLNKEGPYYGITVMHNFEVVGANSRAPRDRVKRLITQSPGLTEEQLAQELRMTANMAGNALRRLIEAGEIYKDTETGGWHAGERRKAPRGLVTSIWSFAESHARS
jgi:hypothetical protein